MATLYLHSLSDAVTLLSVAMNRVDNFHEDDETGPDCPDCIDTEGVVIALEERTKGIPREAYPCTVVLPLSFAEAVQLNVCLEQAADCPDLYADDEEGLEPFSGQTVVLL
jgi:hypothetical protein